MLRAGPWCWPEQSSLASRAREIAGPKPVLKPGDAPLLSLSDLHVELSALRTRALPDVVINVMTFAHQAKLEWREAAVALPKVLPIVWQSVADARSAEVWAERVTYLCRRGASCKPREEQVLEGRSFGLAFLLSLASRVFDEAIPPNLAASAQISPDGSVERVDGIAAKVSLLRADAPAITKFLVATDNAEEARRAAYGCGLEIIPVASGKDAIAAAFGRDLENRLIDPAADMSRQLDVTEAFFRLALNGRPQIVDWAPVERGAARALTHWRGVKPEYRWRLALARAAAARHERNDGQLHMPRRQWLKSLSAPRRMRVLAQLVEHSAETGRPRPTRVEALANPYLGKVHEAFVPHLELRAAVARLYSVTRRLPKALEFAREATEGLIEREAHAAVLVPLADWFRIAGILGDARETTRAAKLLYRTELLFSPSREAIGPVELSQARAQVLLDDGANALATLRALSNDHEVFTQVRRSAMRWLARVLDESGDTTEADSILAKLEERGAGSTAEAATARKFAALVRLDRALRDDDTAGAQLETSVLAEEDPGLIANLCGGRHVTSCCARIATEYPD